MNNQQIFCNTTKHVSNIMMSGKETLETDESLKATLKSKNWEHQQVVRSDDGELDATAHFILFRRFNFGLEAQIILCHFIYVYRWKEEALPVTLFIKRTVWLR